MKEILKSLYLMNAKRVIVWVLAGVIIVLPVSPAFAQDMAASPPATSAPADVIAAPPANTM